MNRAKKYLLNATLLSCVTVIIRGISVSFNAYVTQKIGSEAMGLFTLVMSVYAFAVTLATSGVNLAAVRLTAKSLATCIDSKADTKTLKKALRREMMGCIKYSLFFGIFASLLLFILADVIGLYLLKDTRTVSSLRLSSLALLPISLSSALAGYFTGLRKIYKNALISILEQFVKIIITTAALLTVAKGGIEYACMSVVGGAAIAEGASLIIAFVLYLFDKNKTDGNMHTLPPQKGSALTRASAIAFPVAAGLYVRQGLLCAEHIAIPSGLRRYGSDTTKALASYASLHAMAFPIIFFPASVISAFASLLIPELTESAALGKTAQVKRISEKVVRFSLIFSVGCAGLFLAFGDDMGLSIYNSASAGKYISAFAPLVPVMYLDTAVDSVLKGLGKQLYCMKVNILDSSLSLILVLILVPKFGTWGYVACVYVAEIVNAALSIGKMLSETKIHIPLLWIVRPMLAILIATTAVRLFTSYYPVFDTASFEIFITFILYSVTIVPKSSFFTKEKSFCKCSRV